MVFSDKWLQFSKAQDEYFTRRYEFMQDKATMLDDLKKTLESPEKETALRLLREMQPHVSITVLLLSEIMDTAIDSPNTNAIGLARDVLFNYKNETSIRENIQTIAMTYLAENDEWREWRFRRTAELYKQLNYQEELTSLVSLCRESSDSEIQGLADEFVHYLP